MVSAVDVGTEEICFELTWFFALHAFFFIRN